VSDVLRRLAPGLVLAALVMAVAVFVLTSKHGRGYLGPVFSPDGAAVVVLVRDVRATVVGLGYEFWSPPARVWLHQDRFRLVSLRLSDGRETTLREFPGSPLEGASFSAYHGAIFGEARGHLHWAGAGRLEYELSVTRPDQPVSRTFVLRHREGEAGAPGEDDRWTEGGSGMGGDEPAQLSDTLEVIAPRGAEGLPCAVVLLDSTAGRVRALTDASACSTRYPDGLTPASLADQSRRADIERSETIRTTYDGLVADGLAQGLSDGDARLRAGKAMERLGWFPKSPTLAAEASRCDGASPVFTISDEEFRVGLFQDIAQAIDSPGTEVDTVVGGYVIHRDYDTSRRLNAFLADRSHRVFFVQGRGGCWRMTVDRHEARP
jgi:hypothetical protein